MPECGEAPIELIDRFRVDGTVVSVERLVSGHIHDTWVSRVNRPTGIVRFVHQRINDVVFPSPQALMRNVARVTDHLREKIRAEGGDPARETLTIVPTREGDDLLRTDEGRYWRTYEFIEGARTYDVARDGAQVEAAGRAWAVFQRRMSDLPPPRLEETIPHFGDTARRFAALRQVVDADPHGRVSGVEAEIEFAERHEPLSRTLSDLQRQGRVPERIAHYDTKLNNVMIDDRTGAGICIIDLDTVMPGTVLYDFGDFVRLGASRVAEDTRDLSAVRIDLDLFDHLVRGYLGEARTFLVADEIEQLVAATTAVTYTVGVRFLTDYIEGDVYFRTARPGQNLDRCRTQFALVREIQRSDSAMRELVEKYR